jgi:hypothetical protein
VGLRELFTEDATYSTAPYRNPYEGLPAIAELWEAEREGPDEAFTMSSEIVAVDGPIAVVRVDVGYGDPPSREYRDLADRVRRGRPLPRVRGVAVLSRAASVRARALARHWDGWRRSGCSP